MANYYFSGQGSLKMAERDPVTGEPLGFLPLGNIPELTLNIEVTKFEAVCLVPADSLETSLLRTAESHKKFVEIQQELALEAKTLAELEGSEYYAEFESVTDKMGSDKPHPVSHISYSYATQMAILGEDGNPAVVKTPAEIAAEAERKIVEDADDD